jgi:hypothetical protein
MAAWTFAFLYRRNELPAIPNKPSSNITAAEKQWSASEISLMGDIKKLDSHEKISAANYIRNNTCFNLTTPFQQWYLS